MSKSSKTILGVIVAVLVIAVAYLMLTKPDNRDGFEKVGDAVSELPNGVDNAARELEDRTPGEKIADEVKDATDSQ
jgi:hypothetical protein